MPPTLIQISISPGGIPKTPIDVAHVTFDGIVGDRQRNLKYHGGRDRAVCLYSQELYAELQAEGFNIRPGDLGENFTTCGVDLQGLAPGSRLRVGDCLIEITKVRVPCTALNRWHPELMKAITGRSGWVARVMAEGDVKPGDEIECCAAIVAP